MSCGGEKHSRINGDVVPFSSAAFLSKWSHKCPRFSLTRPIPSLLAHCFSEATIVNNVDRCKMTDHVIMSQERRDKLYLRSKFLAEVVAVLFEVYKSNGPTELLSATNELSRTCLQLAIACHPWSISLALARRGDILTAQYELCGDITILESSIRLLTQALAHPALSADSELTLYTINTSLAYALFHRFRVFGDADDCRACTKYMEHPLASVRPDSLGAATHLIVSGLIKTTRSFWAVVPMAPQNLAYISTRLSDLRLYRLPKSLHILALLAKIKTYWALAFMTQRKDYVQEGLWAGDQAMRLCPESAEVIRYQIVWERGVLHDLGSTWGIDGMNWRASMYTSEQLMSSPLSERNSHIRCVSLYSWSRATLQLATERESVDLMEQAVNALRQCVSICQPKHVFKPFALTQYAATLIAYFRDSGRVSILKEADTFLDLYSDYVNNHPLLATEIAKLLLLHAQVSDVKTAESRINQAIHICTIRRNAPGFGQADKTEAVAIDAQMVHATRLQLRLGSTPVLDPGAILKLAREGLAKEETVALRIDLFLAEMDALKYLAVADHDGFHLQEAEHVAHQALSVTATISPVDHIEIVASQADVCVAQSDLLHDSHSNHAAASTLERAWNLYHEAVWPSGTGSALGGARQRFQICLRWANQAMSRGYMKEAFTAYSAAMDLLPRVVFLGEEVIGRIEALRQVNGLAASSGVSALSIGNISMAVQFLECARGVLWLQSLQIRPEQLHSVPRHLRTRFFELNQALASGDSLMWSARRQTAQELHEVVGEIRAYPDMDRFLLPPLIDDIASALATFEGYALILIPSNQKCHVVVLGTHEGPTSMIINDVDFDHIRTLRREFLTACTVARKSRNNTPRGIRAVRVDQEAKLESTGLLSELWTSLVRPIFNKLGILNISAHQRKRIWWCPIGELSSLPFHAAGLWNSPLTETVSAYSITSYTPTLTALHRILNQAKHTRTCTKSLRAPRALLVAQTDTAGQPSLPDAALEVQRVQAVFPPTCFVDMPDAHDVTVQGALLAVQEAQIVHLACHGHQNQENPIESGFDLKDGRLTIGQLMRTDAPHAQLAYLSACESAGTDESRPDEGLNLAGTMLFVGFISVIATLWAMDDIDGPFMAERVYKLILQDGQLNMAAVPYAVDEAVRELRESGVPASRWATYVHFGV